MLFRVKENKRLQLPQKFHFLKTLHTLAFLRFRWYFLGNLNLRTVNQNFESSFCLKSFKKQLILKN